ncbi:MAG TPA: arginase family protein [Gaiellaceae bacterium]|nr:arginase family protein [Gaiellaceae bacterium]
MSSLRARCPACRTWTAVAVGRGYECHACGRTFAAGLVRVPRAWGSGGEAMAEGAFLDLPYPETGIVAKDTLEEQSAALAALLPERPLVLGGCCCAHVGAVRGLAARVGRLGLVWLDAHGDLNTSESSPSGNLWGMPLRMLVDSGLVKAEDVALVGARSLDPGELEFLADTGIDDSLERALDGVDAVYVALDVDVLDPGEAAVFVPEPGGPMVRDVEEILGDAAGRAEVAGVGVTGHLRVDRNVAVVSRLLAAVGLETRF